MRRAAPRTLLAGLAAACGLACGAAGSAQSGMPFVRREGDRLLEGDAPFRFLGAACTDMVFAGDRPATDYEIRDAVATLRQMGQRAVRVYALSMLKPDRSNATAAHVIGPRRYDEESFRALDAMLAEARRQDLRIILPVIDQYEYVGGIDSFARLHGGHGAAFFRDGKLRAAFCDLLSDLVQRRNHLTGVRYRDDPAILAWQLGNEFDPAGPASSGGWEREMAAHLKAMDPNHLVASGVYGITDEALSDPNIDIVDTHHYPGGRADWIDRDEKRAARRKVVIVGEFGIQGGASAVSAFLDRFENSRVAGANLWAVVPHSWWGGYMRWHPEPAHGFARLHWPHWDDDRRGRHWPAEALIVLREGARRIGSPTPAPDGAPQLLPILDPARIAWRGVAGARRYVLQRGASPKGPWREVARGVSDHECPGPEGALFSDRNPDARSPWYRVRVDGDGRAPWSEPVRVGAVDPLASPVPHRLAGNRLTDGGFEGERVWEGVDGRRIVRVTGTRCEGRASLCWTAGDWPALLRPLYLEGGKSYRFSCMVRAEKDTRMAVKFLTDGAPAFEQTLEIRCGSWRPVVSHLTLPPGGIGGKWYVGAEHARLWLDDLALCENPQTMNAAGPGAE